MSSAAGYRREVLRCLQCRDLFGLAPSVGKGTEKLSDPFEAICPHCGDRSTYPKSAIEVLEAR
jgi:hypothetical protein